MGEHPTFFPTRFLSTHCEAKQENGNEMEKGVLLIGMDGTCQLPILPMLLGGH